MATYWENSCSFGLRTVSRYKYLIVSLVFSHFGFWSGNLFLIAPFPDLCLLVPFDVCEIDVLKYKQLKNELFYGNNLSTPHINNVLENYADYFTVSFGCECYRRRLLMPQTRLFYPTHYLT